MLEIAGAHSLSLLLSLSREAANMAAQLCTQLESVPSGTGKLWSNAFDHIAPSASVHSKLPIDPSHAVTYLKPL
ncbi:hypothetical protein PoB_000432800 [Plakobranchus ocellatus]|uniref:Uncharacterized protein n=1 Tax=Plakobranchus ocellatus TaxID=259542 RepID=A0AAV3Y5I8_9GAST|nr:hypothetical protein PoB_000432800 [Plakobranchus ocellatus]